MTDQVNFLQPWQGVRWWKSRLRRNVITRHVNSRLPPLLCQNFSLSWFLPGMTVVHTQFVVSTPTFRRMFKAQTQYELNMWLNALRKVVDAENSKNPSAGKFFCHSYLQLGVKIINLCSTLDSSSQKKCSAKTLQVCANANVIVPNVTLPNIMAYAVVRKRKSALADSDRSLKKAGQVARSASNALLTHTIHRARSFRHRYGGPQDWHPCLLERVVRMSFHACLHPPQVLTSQNSNHTFGSVLAIRHFCVLLLLQVWLFIGSWTRRYWGIQKTWRKQPDQGMQLLP